MTYAVIADMGGTILEDEPWSDIRKHPIFLEQNPRNEVLRFLPIYFGAKIGIVSDETFRDQWSRRMASVLKGLTRDQITEIYRTVLTSNLPGRFRNDVIEILREHQARGAKVLLASGMFTEMLDLMVDYFGFDGAVGTKVTYDRENRCTGVIDGETCIGVRKVALVKKALNTLFTEPIEPSMCYAYADSLSDVPFIAAFGHPVAVYPDPGMRQTAEKQGWTIVPE